MSPPGPIGFQMTKLIAALISTTSLIPLAGCRAAPPASAPAAAATAPAAGGQKAPAPASAALPADMSGILVPYRQIIVLLEDGRSLELADQPRAELAGRLLYQQKHDRLSALAAALSDDLGARSAKLDRV